MALNQIFQRTLKYKLGEKQSLTYFLKSSHNSIQFKNDGLTQFLKKEKRFIIFYLSAVKIIADCVKTMLTASH